MIRRNPPALFQQYKVPHQIRYTLAFFQYSIDEKTGQVGGWALGANARYEFTIEDTAWYWRIKKEAQRPPCGEIYFWLRVDLATR